MKQKIVIFILDYNIFEYEYLTGEEETSHKIARKMLAKNVDIKLIIECTGLSKGEIEKLK